MSQLVERTFASKIVADWVNDADNADLRDAFDLIDDLDALSAVIAESGVCAECPACNGTGLGVVYIEGYAVDDRCAVKSCNGGAIVEEWFLKDAPYE